MMTLHDAILKVLQEAGRPLTAGEIADRVRSGGLYVRKDGRPDLAAQVSARIRNYSNMFDIDRTARPQKYSVKRG